MDIMLGLLDRSPKFREYRLVFTQPAHQQRFTVAQTPEKNKGKVDIRHQYTVVHCKIGNPSG